jgi:hypothetical protein
LAKSNYFLEINSSLIDFLDASIIKHIKLKKFDDLIKYRDHWSVIPDKELDSILKDNVSAVVKMFADSESFDSGGSNSRLLVRISDCLDSEQWRNILENFFRNDQLYHSRSCRSGFESLFERSLELSNFNSVRPYWLDFRENLNRFNSSSNTSLKNLIDSHLKMPS